MVDQEAPGSLRLHPQAPPSEAMDADTLLRGRDSKGQLLDWGAPAPKLELIYIAQATQQPISTPAKVCAKSAKRVRCWMSLLQPHGPPTGSTGPARPTPTKATGASIIQLLTPHAAGYSCRPVRQARCRCSEEFCHRSSASTGDGFHTIGHVFCICHGRRWPGDVRTAGGKASSYAAPTAAAV